MGRAGACILGTVAALGACGGGAVRSPAPVVSPTGVTFPPGTPPVETRFSQTAALYLRSGRTDEALRLARQGIDAEPGNPIHHFLAGVAHARLGEYDEAHRGFLEAERLYPAYALEIEPEREAAWTEAFNRGVEAYSDGEIEGALRAWRAATTIFDIRPEAHTNLGKLLEERGRYDEAVDVYRRAIQGLGRRPMTRVLGESELRDREAERRRVEASLADVLLVADRFVEAEALYRGELERDPMSVQAERGLASALAGQGRHAEAAEVYDDLLSRAGLGPGDLFDLGVVLFRSSDFARAAEAFERLTEVRPDSRDVWFNYANALFAAEAWESLIGVGDRLLTLDPLSQNAGLIVARAHLESGDDQAALRRLARVA
ncbi:MAG TPA: tetratricopeptide repeat protein, partial [Longimicrobiales bacterium]|nr:tetratricopeptide repeat protein [Longimicrobiales bacterium]